MLINIKKTFSSSPFLKALEKNLRAIMYIFLLQIVNVFCQYLSKRRERRKMYLNALVCA